MAKLHTDDELKIAELERQVDDWQGEANVNADLVRLFVSAAGPGLQAMVESVKPHLIKIRRYLEEQTAVEYRTDPIAVFDQLMTFLANETNDNA
jgi:hypothetical protein